MRTTLPFSILAVLDLASSSAVKLNSRASKDYLYFGVTQKYGATSKVTATIDIGNAYRQPSYVAVLDTGSANFWTWQDNAVLHWGSETPGVEGSCNMTIHKLYQYTPSNSPTSIVTAKNTTYTSVGNTELVSGVTVANDGVSFIWKQTYVSLKSVDLALENYGIVNKADDGSCTRLSYDEVTVGLSPYTSQTEGPSFRKGLFDSDLILSETMTLWFDQYVGALGGAFSGGVAFGGIDSSKYTGPLIRVPSATEENEDGVYVNKPKFSIAGKKIKLGDDSTATCSINSGASADTLPFLSTGKSTFLSAAGLVEYNGIAAYPGTCESIPQNSTLTYKFPGVNCNETVSIDVPLRNYVRGLTSAEPEAAGLCLLNLELGGGCALGAPFLSAAFLALDNSDGAVALAQGGVAVAGSGLNTTTFKVLGRGESF